MSDQERQGTLDYLKQDFRTAALARRAVADTASARQGGATPSAMRRESPIKDWWAQWGRLCSLLGLLGLLIIAGWNGWQYWQRAQTAKAAALYEQLQLTLQNLPDNHGEGTDIYQRAVRIAADLKTRFGRTPYAQMGALQAAQLLYNAADTAGAQAQLQWAAEHGSDAALRALARLRLAGVLLDQQSYQAGLQWLTAKVPAAFKGLVADRRGDLLIAQGKRAEARAAYQQALQTLGEDDAVARQQVQLKLDAIGG